MTSTLSAAEIGLPSSRRAFFRSAAATAIIGSVSSSAVSAASSSDAELLRLGAEFERAWEHEASCWRAFSIDDASDDERLWAIAEAAADRTGDVVNKIEACQATTLAGVLVKVRACSHCHSGEPFDGTFLNDGEGRTTTDFRLAEAILHDLLAIDGRPIPQNSMGICS